MAKENKYETSYMYYIKKRGTGEYVSEIEPYHGSYLTKVSTDLNKALLCNYKEGMFEMVEELNKRSYRVRWIVGMVKVICGHTRVDMGYQASKEDIAEILGMFYPHRDEDQSSLSEIAKFACYQKVCNEVLRFKHYNQNRRLGKVYAKVRELNSSIENPSVVLTSARLLSDVLDMDACFNLIDFVEREMKMAIGC